MNLAERRRDERIAKLGDVALLKLIVEGNHGEDISAVEIPAFIDMLASLTTQGESRRSCLSKKQRTWAEEVARRIVPIAVRDVPVGRRVETPAVLRNLPKSPPGRRST